MKTFRRCPKEYHFRYELCLVSPHRAAALRFGSVYHVGLETWWKTTPNHRLQMAIEAMRSAGDVEPFDMAKAEILIVGYDTRWQDARLFPLAVEKEFCCPLVNPRSGMPSRTWELRGKIDLIAKDDNDDTYVVEHKTSSEDISPGSPYWARLTLDGQISVYYVGARSLGYDVAGCVYDVVGKPKQAQKMATPVELRQYILPKYKQCPECKKKKASPPPHAIALGDGEMVYCEDDPAGGPRRVCTDEGGRLHAGQRDTNETIDEYRDRLLEVISSEPERWFQRGLVVRLEEEEAGAGLDTWQLAKIIRDAQITDRWPRNPDACQRYGRMCDYWPLCTKTGSLHDYVERRAHEELGEKQPHVQTTTTADDTADDRTPHEAHDAGGGEVG
jgi:hypothetical protein